MNVVELRQYTTVPGRRDELIALFERMFLDLHDELGSTVIGTFTDFDDPDRFVWLRGFADLTRRYEALDAFYTRPVWRQHRDAANATILDSDNVLLLKPAWDGSGFAHDGTRAPAGSTAAPKGIVSASICSFARPVPATWLKEFRAAMPNPHAAYVTEPGPNSFPRLPVREGENVFVWFELLGDEEVAQALPGEVARDLIKPVEVLRLGPTPRSRIHA